MILSLDETAARLALDFGDERHRSRDTKVRLEQNLLEFLERPLDRAGTDERANIGQRNVFYFGP